MVNSNSNKNNEITFSETVVFVIDEIIKKYEFEKTEEEMLEKMDQIESFEEKLKIFEAIPSRQIAKTIKETAQNKIQNKDTFINVLQERLNVPEKTAQKLTKDLEEKILNLMQINLEEKEIPLPEKIKAEKEKPSLPAEEIEKTEETEKLEKSKEKIIKNTLPEKTTKKDTYRESIE